ncbi:hypothetical protein RF11_12544 [Thelohanellus kitauei]|uniref:Uncharacterized protein n=1 Tax=Thelohanellus kitauei TaxID=669202 RepID=A0A0C2NB59_THEKT|nr:hypothetical protein RF11_12544 [Thelohanellus kitauei]
MKKVTGEGKGNKGIIKGFSNSLAGILGRDLDLTLVMDNLMFHHFAYSHSIALFSTHARKSSKIKNCAQREGRMKGTENLVSRMESSCSPVSREELSNYISYS